VDCIAGDGESEEDLVKDLTNLIFKK